MEKIYKCRWENIGLLLSAPPLAVLFFWAVIKVDGWWYKIVCLFFCIIFLAGGMAFIHQRVKTKGKRRLVLGETAITLPSEWGEVIDIAYSDILEIEIGKDYLTLVVYTDQVFETEDGIDTRHETYVSIERKKMKNRKQFPEVCEEIQARVKHAEPKPKSDR